MPELPEVETVCRGLRPVLQGTRLEAVRVHRPDLRFPFPERFAERLDGARVTALSRRAKYLLVHLDSGEVWVVHLGMTGRFVVEGLRPGQFVHEVDPKARHRHMELTTSEGQSVAYEDPRRFGYMQLIPESALAAHPSFAKLGPEPLGNGFHGPALHAALSGRKQAIKLVLLDQSVVAGLGNIYVCEALFLAGIDPDTPAGTLSAAQCDQLVPKIRGVLEAAIAAGGSSIRDFAHSDGELGYFQHSFAVYGREGEACVRTRCRGVIARKAQGGRSTFYCPVCQV